MIDIEEEEETEEEYETIIPPIILPILTTDHNNPNAPLSHNKLWGIFFLCILFYGTGIFIVYIPSKLYGINVDNSYSIISLGRLLGGFLILLTTKKKDLTDFLNLLKFKNLKNSVSYYYSNPRSQHLRANMFAFISPIFSTLGYFTYDILIVNGQNVSLITSLTSLYILLPIFYGIFFLKDTMNKYRYFGLLLMITAVVILGFDKNTYIEDDSGDSSDKNNNEENILSNNVKIFINVLLIILTIFLWGMASVIRIYSLKRIKYSQFLYISLIGQLFNFLLSLIQFFIQSVEISEWTLVLICGQLIVYLGSTCSVIISSDSETAKWSALTQTSSIITITLSILIFKDPITPILITGFILLLMSGLFIKIR